MLADVQPLAASVADTPVRSGRCRVPGCVDEALFFGGRQSGNWRRRHCVGQPRLRNPVLYHFQYVLRSIPLTASASGTSLVIGNVMFGASPSDTETSNSAGGSASLHTLGGGVNQVGGAMYAVKPVAPDDSIWFASGRRRLMEEAIPAETRRGAFRQEGDALSGRYSAMAGWVCAGYRSDPRSTAARLLPRMTPAAGRPS